jgi:ADP-L-glycero-D-manno-heptose 6-epimerase
MTPHVVVTGGAGFIGSNLVAQLNARGIDNITIVDRLGSEAKWKNLVGLAYDDYVDKQDFLRRLTADAMDLPEVIFHLGACVDTTETDADHLMENNTQFTRELCHRALAKGARFIYASSAATYGDGAFGYSDDDAVTPRLRPLNMYAYSKHAFDLHALRHGLFDRIVGLKYFNVYGPGEAHKGAMRSMVHKAYGQIKARGVVRLFKSHREDYQDGLQFRDFIYVKDATDVTLWFFDHPEASGLFNCGTGAARTWLDLANAVFNALGEDPDIDFIDMPESLRGTYQYFTQADMSKLRAAGYEKEFTSLEDGIGEYVRDYLAAGRADA